MRFLFLLRKTYLIKFWNTYFSQWGEDIVIERFIGKIHPDKSCYIDVGCFHPKKYSNTYRLYRKRWSGINIDVDRIKIDVFNLARAGDENVCCAVGDTPGSAILYSFGYYSLLNTLHPDKAKEYIQLGFACEEASIQVRTLTDIFESSRFKHQQIALLNIDVEGNEESVLRSLDFHKHRPSVILVEIHVTSLDSLQKDRAYQFLTAELGYEMVNWTGLTVFFMDKERLQAFSVLS